MRVESGNGLVKGKMREIRQRRGGKRRMMLNEWRKRGKLVFLFSI